MFPQKLIRSLLNHCESLIIGRKKLLFTLKLKIFEGKGYSALIGRMIWNLFKLVGEICLLVNLRKLRKRGLFSCRRNQVSFNQFNSRNLDQFTVVSHGNSARNIRDRISTFALKFLGIPTRGAIRLCLIVFQYPKIELFPSKQKSVLTN